MIEVLQAIILGVVQGITEFLPISSSAHLNLFPWFFGWESLSDSFDVALHIGTLLAILLYFWKDFWALLQGGFATFQNWLAKGKKEIKPETALNGKMFWYIVLATIPAGILSLVLSKISDKWIGENQNMEMGLIAVALIVMGILLYFVDKKSRSEVSYEKMNKKQAIAIGASQAIAAGFPGVSRSGITMTVARALKLDRESAAKFSFLLAAPIIAAAAIFDFQYFTFSIPFFVGILASFLSGVLVIRFLMEYLKKGSFKVFAIYRVLLGILVFAILCIR